MLNELSVLSQPEYLWLNLIAFVVFAGFVMWAPLRKHFRAERFDVALRGADEVRPAERPRRAA